MRILLTTLIVFALTPTLWGQEAPKAEIFGGYSYLNVDTQGLTSRQSWQGWEGSAAFNINRWIGFEADVSGHYKGNCGNVTDLTCKDLSFLFGPRFTYRQGRVTTFAHGIFGGDNASAGAYGLSASETKFALAAGGGLDYAVTKTFAIRIVQGDYFMTQHLQSIGGTHQNNFRLSTGVVFTFGGRATTAPPTGRAATLPPQIPNTSEAALLGVVGYASDAGFKVTSVRPGSPAERIFLKPDDVISRIDGKEVHTGRDIESAVAASPSGTVKVTGLTSTGVGMIPFEREANTR